MAGDVTLTFNHFPTIAAAFPERVGRAVRKIALDIERGAKNNVQANGQIDTGFMLNSIYTVTETPIEGATDYNSAVDAAKAKNPLGEFLPKEEEASRPTQAAVCVGAAYGVYQEFGTSHQPARPYLVPAVEKERPAWEQALRTLELQLRDLVGGE